MKHSRGPATNVQQQITNCTLLYDLTEHSMTVFDNSNGLIKVKIWRLRDNPGGFDITLPDYAFEINNPTGTVFIPVESEPV